jgi:integrase
MARGGMFRLAVGDLSKLAEGFYADGGNLYLQVERNSAGDGFSRRWIFRYKPRGGRQRDMGLGSVVDHGANANGLSSVRELAQNARQLLAAGRDPLDERRRQIAERAAALPVPTFEKVTADYLAAHDGDWQPRVLSHWRMTLTDYAKPLHKLPVNLVETDHVLKCVQPIWNEKNSTAVRVRSRIEAVLSFATVKKYRSGENPARWRGHLDHLLAKPSKIAPTETFAAMDYRDMPAFMAELRGRKVTISNLALEFLILTCARTDEVLKAVWSEIDLDESRWSISGERMKAGKDHDVPLSARALAILKEAREISSKIGGKAASSPYVFALGRNGSHLSTNALRSLLQRRLKRDVTVHGFRACFKTWASEETNFPNELSEMALAHAVGNKVEQAYRRGTGFKKRVALADAWASYVGKPRRTDGKVVTFKRA